ncbi:hypothetical protein N7526_006587 [Penicillium atrosanguineum]|nr:hypothetical protein N7526_006587 [Penicillium atrosanguineum]
MAEPPPPSYEASQSSARFPNTQREDLPPYHNWQEAVPDTSTFPPPPISGYYCSGTGNASEDDAQRAHDFCDNTPLWPPERPSPTVYASVSEHDIRPVLQKEFIGELSLLGRAICLFTSRRRIPPFIREKSKMIYFEVKLLGLRAGPGSESDSSGFSIGFAAGPYPSWRSPGWERASLGVFSDDGCRFVNDSWGGRDFTSPINVGETVGIGIVFTLPENPLAMADALFEDRKKCKVEVFFTRNGRRAGGWDLHEETDEESGGIEGLEGDFDLYGAIGLFGGVDFEAYFDPAAWLWKADR